MNIIISHSRLDFDGLASMVAAHKLYPDSIIVLADKPGKSVQEFISLYKDSLEINNYKNLDLDDVSTVIVVDTKKRNRIGPFNRVIDNPQVEVVIYDHHPESKDDIKASYSISEPVGATVTLFVERIIKEKLTITPFEATVMALGIYQDTGSLLFTSTTVRDIRAVAWLLDKGANLKVVADFIERPLSLKQQELLNLLIQNSKTFIFNGIRTLVSSTFTSSYIGGLDLLTQKLADVLVQDVVFTAVAMKDRIFLVGRSNVDCVPMNEILACFGGGGHEKAASAVIKGKKLSIVLSKLNQLLQKKIRPNITAKDIMSSPVKTVIGHQPISTVSKIMLRYGHSGFPVVDDEQIIGIISRRDVEKAEFHGLGHAPVKGFMSTNVIGINPETPIPEIERVLIENDIGRLPVIKEGKLVGIISRTDVLRVHYGSQIPRKFQSNVIENIYRNKGSVNLVSKMKLLLPGHIFDLINKIGGFADSLGYRLYLVGGFVRDLLLALPNFDLDIVVEGDGIDFAKSLAKFLDLKILCHDRFGTANLFFPNGLKIDVASARKEFYEYPAALPMVESGSLKQDLYRRDFTINAMAIGLNQDNIGTLYDFFSGESDLKQGIIRVLYNLSFVEDPTRIIRAVRFEQRYNFLIEPQTLNFARQVIMDGLITKLSYHRIREELMQILTEGNPYSGLERLDELGIWQCILPEVRISHELKDLFQIVSDSIFLIKKFFPSVDQKLFLLILLFHDISVQQVENIDERFNWPKRYREEMIKTAERRNDLKGFFYEKPVKLSNLHKIFHDLSSEALAYFYLISDDKNRYQILNYLNVRKKTKLAVNGKDLINLGLKPGPKFQEVLNKVFESRLNGTINTKDEELDFIKQITKNERGD